MVTPWFPLTVVWLWILDALSWVCIPDSLPPKLTCWCSGIVSFLLNESHSAAERRQKMSLNRCTTLRSGRIFSSKLAPILEEEEDSDDMLLLGIDVRAGNELATCRYQISHYNDPQIDSLHSSAMMVCV